MSKRYYKLAIEDIHSENCNSAQVDALANTFENTVKTMATTLARKSWYKLKDFASAKHMNIDQFTLTIERQDVLGQEQWFGVFECGNQTTTVLSPLEKA